MVSSGQARTGESWSGKARQSGFVMSRSGMAGSGPVWQSRRVLVRYGVDVFGMAMRGAARRD